MIFGKKTQKTP